MAIPSDVQAAIVRLNGGYNNGDYNASTNPLGFSNGGHRTNLYALTADMTLIGDWFYGQIEPIAEISTQVQALGLITTEIQTVAGMDDEVVLLAGLDTELLVISSIAAQIIAVAGNSVDIGKVATIDADVSTVADIATAVSTVASREAAVVTVAARDADIATVADRDTDIGVIAAGMAEILAAPDYAAAAQAAIRPYAFKIATADENPGSGAFRLNNADPTLATLIYISTVDAAGASQAAFLDVMDDSTTLADRGQITLTRPDAATNQLAFRVNGAVTTATGYRKVPVAYIGGGGVIAVDNVFALAFARAGDKGLDGTGTGDVVGPAGATAGNFPVLDATGKVLADSGKKPADFATSAQGTKADSALQPSGLPTVIHDATAKATPVDADEFGLVDSAASNVLKKITWANVKATLKTYFDTLYGALATANQWTKPQRTGITALTSGSTITINGNSLGGNIMSLLLEHIATMANPVNLSEGTTFSIIGQQDSVGGRTLAYAANWIPLGSATAPAIPSAPNARFHITGQVGSGGLVYFNAGGAGV